MNKANSLFLVDSNVNISLSEGMKFKSLLILPLLVVSLKAATVDDLTFLLNEAGTEYSITECNEYASGDLEIPSTYQGFPVTTVADEAFKDCTSLTSIIIPDSIITLGEESFYNTGITSIEVPNSVISIGLFAFQNCRSLTTVTLPDSLTRIEAETFFLTGVTSINIPSNLEYIGGSAILTPFEIPDSVTYYGAGNGGGFGLFGDPTVNFSNGLGYRLSSSGEKAYIVELGGTDSPTISENIVIPQKIGGADVQSVTFTGWLFFDGLGDVPNITSITVSEGIVSITDGAFWGLEDLVNVYLPDSLTTIGWSAFRNCTSLSSITIPKNVSTIEGVPFVGTSSLNEIIVDPDNAHYSSVDNSLYDKSLQTLVKCRADAIEFTVPNTVKTIDNAAFEGLSNLTSVIIPNSVTSIRGGAFGNCPSLNSITIPGSVTSIEEDTFRNCTGLTSFTIPDSVTSIKEYAFENCTGLTSIIIPDSVTSIEKNAFNGCNNLTSITIGAGLNSLEGFTSEYDLLGPLDPESLGNLPDINVSSENPYITVIDGVVFNKAKDTLLDFLVRNTDGSYTIPDSVTTIGENAFYECIVLTSITIPDGVTSIGDGAFYGCYGLTGITIPDGVTSIGSNAFDNCYNLSSIIFNGTAPAVGTDSFSNTFNLKAFVLNDYLSSFGDIGNLWEGLELGVSLSFSQNSDNTYSLTDCNDAITGHLVIPSTYQGSPVTSIGNNAFENCIGITSTTIPDSVTSIGSNAFSGCTSLTRITIPDSVTSIGSYAFSACYGLTSVFIPDSVVTIGNLAFNYCYQMQVLRIGSGLQSSLSSILINIGENTRIIYNGQLNNLPSGNSYYTFAVSTSNSTTISGQRLRDLFSEIYIVNDSSISIPNDRFRSYSNLKSITIPDSVTSIGSYAFDSCSSLTSITIPDRVTSIANSAFSNCTSLANSTLNSASINLRDVGSEFQQSVRQINIPEGTTSISDYAFYNCSNVSNITIPDSVTTIGQYAFDSCTSLSSITIPSSVTTIGLNAFAGCSGLQTVSLNEGLVSIKANAFFNCNQLETISIPSSVRDVGTDAFDNSEELREIIFEGPPPAFSVTNLQSYNITPTMYYKVSPQSWMVYQSSYGLPLVYLGPPIIQVQPQDAIASIGDSVIISVEATDVRETTLSYQWLCNGIELDGETAATLSIDSITEYDVGNYQVNVSNAEGTIVTEGASITIANTNTSNGLYTQEQYDAALTSGFNLGVQSAGGSTDNGNSDGGSDSPGTPAATSAVLDVYYSTDLSSWNLMESIEVENPPEGQMFMKTELTPPSE